MYVKLRPCNEERMSLRLFLDLPRENPRYRRSSKIVGGNPWPSLLSSLRLVLCAPKSGLPSRTLCVFVHCQCAIRDLEFAMSFATNPDTIEQADIDCLGF